jgi:hypothetical protein
VGRKNPVIEFSQLYVRKEDDQLFKLKKNTPNIFEFEDGTKISRETLRLNFTFYGVIDRFGFVIKYVKNGRYWAKEKLVASYEESKWHSVVEAEKGIIEQLNEMNKDSVELSFCDLNLDNQTPSHEKIERRNIYNRIKTMPDETFREV